VVTAPTNGAAGVVPAVMMYYRRFVHGANDDGIVRFLLAAGAIGVVIKELASISGAEHSAPACPQIHPRDRVLTPQAAGPSRPTCESSSGNGDRCFRHVIPCRSD
ncbi:MAG: L-serine ammonia-lyase, iron-sulfur-dependent, subunit alpha, partial [Rhizobiales bacterium]|nr:L-serine ammonia-lyase, iron-sulfur-dependent, subunit alpha [Hyphomicrobiales bacterium]